MQSSRGRVRVECTSNGFGPGNLGLRVLEASSPLPTPCAPPWAKPASKRTPGSGETLAWTLSPGILPFLCSGGPASYWAFLSRPQTEVGTALLPSFREYG